MKTVPATGMEGEMASECKPCRAVRDAVNRRSVLLALLASPVLLVLGSFLRGRAAPRRPRS